MIRHWTPHKRQSICHLLYHFKLGRFKAISRASFQVQMWGKNTVCSERAQDKHSKSYVFNGGESSVRNTVIGA
eukprot:1161976-Pelagomonas_calceolata.AAC.5